MLEKWSISPPGLLEVRCSTSCQLQGICLETPDNFAHCGLLFGFTDLCLLPRFSSLDFIMAIFHMMKSSLQRAACVAVGWLSGHILSRDIFPAPRQRCP